MARESPGDFLVRMGALSPAALRKLLGEASRIEATQRRWAHLERIAFERFGVAEAAIARLQDELRRRLVACVWCGAKNNVYGAASGKLLRCPAPQCRNRFSFTEGLFPKGRRPADPPLPDFPGFRLIACAGEGGQGEVWRAVRVADETAVAAKVVRWPVDPRSGPARKRFARETELLRGLDHPGIVRLLDAWETAAEGVLVFEWVGGDALDALVRRAGPLSCARAVETALQACAALAHVHREGIVHRDLKPANVMMGADGVRIVDFGIARVMKTGGASKLTGTGVGMGTSGFLAPEQARNARDVDQRADIFSLGATIYFAVTGACPFEPTEPAALLDPGKAGAPRPLSARRADCPTALSDLVGRMMAIDPDERPRNAAEVARALRAAKRS